MTNQYNELMEVVQSNYQLKKVTFITKKEKKCLKMHEFIDLNQAAPFKYI